METGYGDSGTRHPSELGQGKVISIFTRRELSSLGGSLASGTRGVGDLAARIVAEVRQAARRSPLLTLGIAAAVGALFAAVARRWLAAR